jgi:predicted GNAT family acetyltransferase
MEAEVTAQSPDNVSDYFNDVVAPAGDFGSEGEFREFISNAENAKSYFNDVVKARGDFGSDQEFNSFLGVSGSSPAPTPTPSPTPQPQPTPQQPVKYVPDSKRKLQKEEIVSLVNTFIPGAPTSSAEIIGNKLAGKTEAEIVKMYPALGKQLATRMQNVQSGQKTSGSQSESSTSVLPSLIDQAKRQEAFSNYERDQRSYADADKNYQAAFDPNMQPWEKSPDIKANQSAVLSSRNTANVSRQEADDQLKPEIRNDVDESFLTINNDGFRVPNVPRINDYAKEMAAKNGLPEDGYFKEYVYNQAMSEASFKAFEPIIDKYFKPESEKILAEYKNKFEKDFTTDEAEQAKLDLQVKELRDRLEAENKAVIDELQPELKLKVEEVDNQWRMYEAQTNQKIELLNNQLKTQAIPREVYDSEFNKIKEEHQKAYDTYGQERNDVFDGFLVAQNNINSKYNARLKRQGNELESAANGRVREAQKKYEAKIGPEKLARLNRAYSEAVKKAQIEYEGEVKKRFGEKAYNPLVSPISSYIMDKLSVFSKSMTVALGGSLKGLGTTMDIDALQALGDEAALAYTLPQARTEEFSDLFDARNFAQLSGQLVGSMAPSLAASAAAGFLTRNAGLVTKLAATGFASWLSESSDMAGRMWDDTFKETGSVAEANSKSQQMWNAQVKMMPLYAFDGLPFIKSGIGRLPFGARVGLGAGIEVVTETLQEIPQNIAEQNIKANKDAFDNLIGLAGDQWKQTVISVAPVALLGGAGQINKTLSPEEKMIEAGRSFGAKAKFSEIRGFGMRDWVANTVLATSEGFATTAINTMFSSGIIDQATRDEMIQLTDEAVQNISDAKGLGMNNGDAMVYNAIANNRNKINSQMLQAKEAGNQSLEITLKEQLSTADKTLREFAATRKGDFGIVTFSDGSSVILNDIRSQESLARIAELLKDKGVNGVKFYSKDGKDLMAQVEAMKAQPETTLEQQAQEPGDQFEAGSQVDLSYTIPSSERTVESPQNSDKNYQEAQEANTIVSQENPSASVLLQPKGNDLSLTAVYVGTENRGKGIGTKVLESVKKQADRLGKKIVLNATNELDNATDLDRLGKFYEKNGFVKVGENQYEYNPATTQQQTTQTAEKTVEQLRADEQAELDTRIENADQYRVDGKVDKTKLTKPEDIAAFDEIYQKYDALITPKLEAEKGAASTQANPLADVESTAKALEGIELDPLFEKTKSTKYFRGQPTEDLPQKDIFISPNEIIGKMYAKGKGVLKNLALKASNLFDIDTTVTKEFNDKLIDAWKKANPQSAIIPKEILNGTHIGKGYSQVLKETPEFRRALEEMGFDGLLNNFSHLQLKLPRQEVIVFDKANVSEINADLISEAYHKAKADGSNPELVQSVEQLLTPQQDATQTGENQPSNQQQREGTAQQQQGQQADRANQEGTVPQGENQTGGSDSTQQGRTEQQTQEVAPTFEEKKAAAKEAIRKAKEKRRQSMENMGIMAADPEQRAYMDIDVVKAYIDLAKVLIEQGIKNFKDFVAEIGEEPNAEMRYAWDVANGNATLDQGLTTTGDGGAGGGTTGDGGTQSDGGNKTGKVRAMIQRVADRMRQKGIPEDQIKKVLEAGTYQPMSMAQMDKAAEALIEEYGLDAALDILRSDQSFNYEIIKALYNRKLGELKNIADTEGATIEQAVEIAKTISDMAAASTSEARSLGFNRFVYINNPDLFYKEKMKEDVESENNDKVKGKGRSNTIRTLAVKARKIRTDAISLLSEVMGGRITAEQLFDPNSKFYLSDNKMRESLKVLLTFGESLNPDTRNILQQMFRDIKGMDKWAREENMDKARDVIKANLKDINGRLPVPLDEASLDELAKNFGAMWKGMVDSYIIANSKEAKPFTSKRDILNQLANVIAGKTDAVVLFATAKNSTINGSERLAKRMEFLMKKLVKQNASEDGGASWKELVKALNLGGIFNALDNQKEVSEAIKNSLRKLNPTLQTPLDTAEIQELADSIVDIYSEIAEGKIKAMLENQLPKPRTFLGRERISRAAKAVIFGALDFGNTAEERATLSKFSVLFGGVDPNQFTDAQKTKLNQLAGNYVKAAPGFQKQIAMQRFNNALQQAIAYQKKWTTLTYHLGRGGFAFENYIYNNLLFAYGTFMKAFRGNIERILEKYITLGLLGETDVIRFNNRRKLPNVELDIDGQNVSVSVNLNEVLDAMYSAVRGLPKLAEAKSTGLNRAELELRDTKSLAGRRLKRFFTIPAGRTLMTLDAMTTTSSVITTKRQVLMQAIIDAYATYGVTKPRAEIQAIVDDILVPTDTAYENALAQAAQDVMNSQLYKDLGMTPADFPILDPRFSKEALGDKAKVYNEWLMRAREILDDQESQRASTSAVNDGWMPMSGTVESMMSQIDSYAAKVTNEMTYLGTPRGSMGVLATEISRISNSAPALKYIGITPMFVNATFNALNNMIRITPGLNVIQFAKYKATGSRGAYSTAGKREYDFESIVNVDKKNMIPTLVMTNLGLVAMLGVLSALRGDDEYEREKIIKGKGTFITPMKMPPWLSAIRNEKGEQVYRPGKIYYNGREVSDYKDGAYSFFFGAVATIDNNRLGFKNNPYADAPFKDEESGATDALYAYVTGVMATASEQSMMREQFKMVNDIMDMMYETPGGEYSARDKLKKLVQRKGGSLVKMLVPYGRMLGDISQVMRDGDDEAMAKQARDFYEYAAQGTAYEEWVLKSNKVDWFGNPVKAEFFRVSSNPFPGFFDKDKGDASREIQMHLSHNYVPVLPPSTRIFVTITKDDLGGEEYLDAYYNSMKAMIDRGEESRVSVDRAFDKYEGGKKLYKGVVSTIELTAEEQSVYNEQRAKFVGAIVKRGSNMSAFEKMDNEGYRAAMDRLYTIGRNYAQLKAVPDLIEKDREDILKAFASQISKFQSDFGSMGVEMPGIGVEINEDFLKNFEK